jgi:DNA-directed RNA polymerase subunit RPC12/RpoP
MPMILYICSNCKNEKTRFFSRPSKDVPRSLDCEKCGSKLALERKLSAPSQKSTIVIDNGVQAKSVELNRDIVEIIEDRDASDLKKRGDAVLENLK